MIQLFFGFYRFPIVIQPVKFSSAFLQAILYGLQSFMRNVLTISTEAQPVFVSSNEPIAYTRCRLNSASYTRLPHPSAIFAAMERDDLTIWSVNAYFSPGGKALEILKISIATACANLYTSRSSTVLIITGCFQRAINKLFVSHPGQIKDSFSLISYFRPLISYLGTSIPCIICLITSSSEIPSISLSGERMIRCRSTGAAT